MRPGLHGLLAQVRALLLQPLALPVAVGAAILRLVWNRGLDTGIQPYGADGAQYLEHTARLRVLKLWQGSESWFPLGFAADADAAFPPVLHLLSLPLGAVFGHSAEVAAATSAVWLLLLAALAGWMALQLGAPRRSAAIAATAILLVPALHGFATRYYYDLPMTVLLWASASVLLSGARGRLSPARGGVLAGLLFAAAALTKWAALAFGIPIVLGVVFVAVGRATGVEEEDGNRSANESESEGESGGADLLPRLRRPLLAAAALLGTAAIVVAAFVSASGAENSLSSMASTAYEGPHGLARLGDRSLGHLAFYPLRSVVSVLSPALSACALPLVFAWLFGSRRALPLVLWVVGGHFAFVLFGMPALDDRFLVPALPILALVACFGWDELPGMQRRALGPLCLAVGLWVAWDFHQGSPSPANQAVELSRPVADDLPPTVARGLGLASSVEGRGWLRADEQRPAARAFRDLLWAVVARERPTYLGVPGQQELIDPWGDLEWWRYRGLLDQVTGPRTGPEVIAICPPPGQGPYEPEQPDLVVQGLPAGALPALPRCLDAASWSLIDLVVDPGSGRQAAFFRPYVPEQP